MAATTDWEEAQRRIGNLPPLAPTEITTTEDEIEALVLERAEKQLHNALGRELEGKADSDDDDLLAELLNDEEGDEFFESYRRKRMEEVRQNQSRESHGYLREISRSEFKDQVTNHAGYCVLLLADNNVTDSRLLEDKLRELAKSRETTKFLRIQATDCIPNYPSHNVPTILVYKGGELVKTFVGLAHFGGRHVTPDDVEWELSRLGVMATLLQSKPCLSQSDRIVVNIVDKNRPRSSSPSA